MCIHIRVPEQRLCDAIVINLQNGWKRFEEVSRKNSSLRLWEVKSQLLDFDDGGHSWTVMNPTVGASAPSRLTDS